MSDASEYVPSSSASDDSGDDLPHEVPADPLVDVEEPDHRIYLVFWGSLLNLISWCCCQACGSRNLTSTRHEIGTLLIVTVTCRDCGWREKWHSQPYFGNTAAGNVMLSAAILFAGATVTKVLRVLSHMKVAVINTRSYFRHQQGVLHQAVQRLWRERQTWLISALQAQDHGIICGGDGRADSPGHSAKFGTYTMMELQEKAIIDVKIDQSNEVGGSYHMEKESLVRSIQLLEDNFVHLETLVTDRHLSIKKMMREKHADILHLFDIWHVAKGIKKEIQTLAKTRECQDVKPWLSSIVNHLYWSVVSTPPGETQLIVAKWKSVVNHIQNNHHGFPGLFQQCTHDPLKGRELRKPWIIPCSRAAVETEKIICNRKLCADIMRLSPAHQTSHIEAFHSLVNHFAPKMFAFSYTGMYCRTILAVLHFNENANRVQHANRGGDNRFSIHYPKYKHGGYIVRKVLEDPTFQYVTDLMKTVQALAAEGYDADDDMNLVDEMIVQPERVRQPLNAAFVKPDKAEAVRAHVTRFQHL